jgi:aminoglycoside phosphotransferase (APT) family kinase protein
MPVEPVVLSSDALRPVVRVGDTVRRIRGPWTPAVHALLRHLEDVGFDGAPRVLGIDSAGREVLSHIAGDDSHHARNPALHSDAALVEVARLIRRFHHAVAGFVPPADARWQFLEGAPREGIICHNDLAPVNAVFHRGHLAAFIDWDFAAPASPVWDLACAAWSFVPLADDGFCRRYGYPLVPRGPRLSLLCDSYGLEGEDRSAFLDVCRDREVATVETIRLGAQRGNAAYARVWKETGGRRWLEAIHYLDVHRADWQRYLD